MLQKNKCLCGAENTKYDAIADVQHLQDLTLYLPIKFVRAVVIHFNRPRQEENLKPAGI